MKDLDKKKIIIFLIIIIILGVGIKNNYKLLNTNSLLKEKETDIEGKGDLKSKETITPSYKNENDKKDKKSKSDIKPKIYVHITGAVNKPGLYGLEDGSRLNDLINLCKGLKKDADINKINLSMKLKDQMRIHILSVDEKNEKEPSSKDNFNFSDSSKININKASLEELKSLPGIGEKRALDIIAYRESNGFNSIEDLKNISGIGDKSIEKLKDLVVFQ